jgi:hypothetical protein
LTNMPGYADFTAGELDALEVQHHMAAGYPDAVEENIVVLHRKDDAEVGEEDAKRTYEASEAMPGKAGVGLLATGEGSSHTWAGRNATSPAGLVFWTVAGVMVLFGLLWCVCLRTDDDDDAIAVCLDATCLSSCIETRDEREQKSKIASGNIAWEPAVPAAVMQVAHPEDQPGPPGKGRRLPDGTWSADRETMLRQCMVREARERERESRGSFRNSTLHSGVGQSVSWSSDLESQYTSQPSPSPNSTLRSQDASTRSVDMLIDRRDTTPASPGYYDHPEGLHLDGGVYAAARGRSRRGLGTNLEELQERGTVPLVPTRHGVLSENGGRSRSRGGSDWRPWFHHDVRRSNPAPAPATTPPWDRLQDQQGASAQRVVGSTALVRETPGSAAAASIYL